MYGSELIDPSLPAEAVDALEGDLYWRENKDYREQNSFLGLLGKSINYSEPGNTMLGMFHQFMAHVQNPHRDHIYVFALTSASRYSWFNNTEHDWEHSTWIEHDPENPWHPTFKNHVVNSDCDELHELTHRSYGTSIINTCKQNDLKYVMFNVLPNPNTINDSNFLMPGSSMYDALQREQNKGKVKYFASGGHPNEAGHRFIATLVKEFIDTVYPSML